jgi:hypothetical protein
MLNYLMANNANPDSLKEAPARYAPPPAMQRLIDDVFTA